MTYETQNLKVPVESDADALRLSWRDLTRPTLGTESMDWLEVGEAQATRADGSNGQSNRGELWSQASKTRIGR